MHPHKISKRSIQLLVTKYTAAFNGNTGISPQKLRHSCATDYIKNDGNIITLRDQLGHSDIKTTRRFLSNAI
ncbi:tyrosine-type recombinase/integrase [Kurthia sibirica]|uniref:tyrosine-type recombinase/integrase n=1 Tax=Kurthia sibirica TaxID=202750 RepID=UPI001FE2D97A|nr:tyrosine-type recombinase/integrase [Kurthia sibirica]